MLDIDALNVVWCTESQDLRAGEDLTDSLVSPLLLNVGELRPREVRDLSEVVCLECVNATLSAPSTKPHFLMMMKKMMLRIAGVLWKLASLLGLPTGPHCPPLPFTGRSWDKNRLCSWLSNVSRISLKFSH